MIETSGERSVAPLEMVAAVMHVEGAEYRMLVRISNDVAVNSAPECPAPDGPSHGQPGVDYQFSALADDLHSDEVFYQWSFGTDTTAWLGSYSPEDSSYITRQWISPDTVEVQVRARDIFGAIGSWSSPLTLMITPSCCDLRADIDDNGSGPDVADLVYLVTYMFQTGPPPPCNDEADVNGNGSGPDVADLVHLVTYMFQAGPPPAACP
jgi:hypothetical protein